MHFTETQKNKSYILSTLKESPLEWDKNIYIKGINIVLILVNKPNSIVGLFVFLFVCLEFCPLSVRSKNQILLPT